MVLVCLQPSSLLVNSKYNKYKTLFIHSYICSLSANLFRGLSVLTYSAVTSLVAGLLAGLLAGLPGGLLDGLFDGLPDGLLDGLPDGLLDGLPDGTSVVGGSVDSSRSRVGTVWSE